jgi:hypothetical protein
MLNNPLFQQTKTDLEVWRKAKKTFKEPVPEEIRKNIHDLSKIYPARRLISSLKLSSSAKKYMHSSANESRQNAAQFVDLSTLALKKEKSDQKRIEIDLPMGMTLRIFL